ncbi:hypothetical protein [Flavobacterium sp.]|jgi:hypothetical protein|uniref:hypothetical protein n=1 Tax=Flavobacterium sp. TaxID=239 RepID=UPI0037BFBC59
MEQTAVEFLQEALSIHFTHEQEMQFIGLFNQALEMDKEQKLEAFIEGYKQKSEQSNLIFDNDSRIFAIHLYNETFNK